MITATPDPAQPLVGESPYPGTAAMETRSLPKKLAVLLGAVAVAMVPRSSHSATPLQANYPAAWERLVSVYGNGTWTLRVARWLRSPDGSVQVETTMLRVLARSSRFRVEEPDTSGAVRTVYVASTAGGFRARRLAAKGSFFLEQWWPDRATAMSELGIRAVSDGWLPLLPWSWFGDPLPQLLVHGNRVQIVNEGWEHHGTMYVVQITERTAAGKEVRGKFWFLPRKGWVLWRWHWPYTVVGGRPHGGHICELRYDRQVDDVPIVSYGQLRHAWSGHLVWEARLVSFDPVPPPETAFTPEAFGITPPSFAGPARLWVWATFAVLVLLTVLLLARLSAHRRPSAQAEGLTETENQSSG